jgi:hypothetical protein
MKRNASMSLEESKIAIGTTPSNLNNIYFDSIEDKIFTQVKIDMFGNAIR